MRPEPGAQLTCHLNRCMLICDSPFGDCDGDPSTGCETVLETTANCGGCGQGCTIDNGFPTCARGVCGVAGCRPGFMDCDALSHNGCESQIRQDAENCGGCGRSCRAGQRCLAGACR
jgi:hypothetical protein